MSGIFLGGRVKVDFLEGGNFESNFAALKASEVASSGDL